MAGENNIGTAYIKIMPSMDGMKKNLLSSLNNEAGSAGGEAGNTVASSLFSSLKSASIKLASAVGIGKIISESITQGADLEQQIGGIETLFGESADKMREYASQAYETAGVSMNDYMSQATSFAASLKQTLSESDAADYANRAIVDMADNANKMGTTLENIQNAYQGFAKQNYTMLDNLKLGYGGTKTEMQRLISDASKMTDTMEELGVTVDANDMSFSNIVNAISVVQAKMGIAGTTAKEAATTYSGSLASMQAAAQNLLSAFMMNGKDGVDVSKYIMPLVSSVNTFVFGNVVPMIGRMIMSIIPMIGTFITEGIPQIVGYISDMFTELITYVTPYLQSFSENGATVIGNFVSGMLSKLPELITSFGQLVNTGITYLMEHLPEFWQKGYEIISSIIQGIVTNLPTILTTIANVVFSIIATIAEHLPEFLQQGFEMLTNVGVGLISALPDIIAKAAEIVIDIWNEFKSYDWLGLGADIISGIANGIANAVSGLVDAAIKACGKLVDGVKSFFGIASPSKLMRDEIGQWIPKGIGIGIEDNIDSINPAIKRVNDAISTGIQTEYGSVISANVVSRLNSATNSLYDEQSDSSANGGLIQNITINSPSQLDPSETARAQREANRQFVLQLKGY